MIATLTFNLPEENQEFQYAIDGIKWSIALHELDQHLRSLVKHSDQEFSDETYDALVAVREKLHEIMTDNNLTF